MTLETVVASEYYEGNSGCMTFSALWVKDHVCGGQREHGEPLGD